MNEVVETPSGSRVTLGQYLASIRNDRGLTLREVEEMTDKEVSNAYLSQIENGRIKRPSPNLLHALSVAYSIDYGYLMTLAGHITPSRAHGEDQRHGRLATFSDHNLTDEEEALLFNYLDYLRHRKRTIG
jgi:HTH-type transcriptional regulator, competence development regulator